MKEETKRCPYCDEEIRFAAVRCRHCGSVLDETAVRSSSREESAKAAEIARHTKNAESYVEEERYAEAEAEIKKAIELDPKDELLHKLGGEIEKLVEERHRVNARALMKEYKFEEAIFEYHEVLAKNPHNEAVMKDLKNARVLRERLGQHILKADGYRVQKRYQDAIDEYELALQIHPNHKYAKSEADQCRLMREESDLLLARVAENLEVAESEYEKKRYRQAIHETRKILEKVPNHPEASKLLQKYKIEDFRRKRSFFIIAVMVLAGAMYLSVLGKFWNQSRFKAHMMEARAAGEYKNWQKAIEMCNKALEYEPDDEECKELISKCISELEKPVKEAKRIMLEAKAGAAESGAPIRAKEFFGQAEGAEAQARSYYLSKEYISAARSYRDAAKEYDAAEEKSLTAMSELERIAVETRKKEIQETALAKQRMMTAKTEADNEQCPKYMKESYSLAIQKMNTGNEEFNNKDYAAATMCYQEAGSIFQQSAQDSRLGTFLPAGLAKKDAEIFSIKDGMRMVMIPDGAYMAGSREGEGDGNEFPRSRIEMRAFYIDKHEVTVGQYKKFLKETGHRPPADSLFEDSSRNNYPVVGVSRDDAVAYAEWAGKRLPTEAEWEYACRAGTTARYCFGDVISHDEANCLGIKGADLWKGTSPVGSFPPNTWRLYDMHGNVWEWCQDWYERNYYKNRPSIDPKGPREGSQAVIRGGSWKEPTRHSLRSANRGHCLPDARREDIGFRCAK